MTSGAWRDTYQSGAVVAGQVFLTDGHEAPESLFGRHMHEEDGSYWGLSLAIAIHRVVDGVGLEDTEQVVLSETQCLLWLIYVTFMIVSIICHIYVKSSNVYCLKVMIRYSAVFVIINK